MLCYVIIVVVVARHFDVLHQHPFLVSRDLRVQAEAPETAPVFEQDDKHWPWCPSYLTQSRLRRHFFLLQAAVAPALPCNFKESPGEVHDEEEEEEEEKTSTPGLPHVLIHQAWHRLQGVGSDVNYAAWCSFRSRTSGGLAWWSHRRFVWLRRAPPLVVISFYNQHMQIKNGQPINHGGAAEYWVAAASKHHRVNSPSDTQRRMRAYSVRDTLKPSNFHLHSSRLIGSGVISARSPGQLFHSLSVQRGN